MQSSLIRTTFMVLGLVVAFVFVPLSGLLPEAAAQGVEESVTGHAEFVNPNNQNHVRHSVSAILHSVDPVTGVRTVSGEVESHLVTPAGDVTSGHGTVTCFTLIGNIARIGGTVDRREPPLTNSADFRLTVVDNGEGSNADLPDLASPIVLVAPGTAQDFCNGAGAQNLFTVERGNIQIRPSGF